jgi:hypothetical protein
MERDASSPTPQPKRKPLGSFPTIDSKTMPRQAAPKPPFPFLLPLVESSHQLKTKGIPMGEGAKI